MAYSNILNLQKRTFSDCFSGDFAYWAFSDLGIHALFTTLHRYFFKKGR